MYLSTALIIASLSFFVQATPASSSGFAIPLTRRSEFHDADGVVNMARLQLSINHSIKKIHHGFQAYHKNTGSSHCSAPKVEHSEKRSVGSVPLANLEWYGTLSVGTPAKNFTVSIDTGSTDLVLPSSTCDSSCVANTLYDSSSSSTSHNLGTPFSLEYPGGDQANGTQYSDNVTIAGYTVPTQIFGAASSYSYGSRFPGWRQDGRLGLAFPSLSTYRATPLFFNLVIQSVLPTNSFGLCSSELYIGGTNSKLYKGDFTYVSITDQAYWQTKIDGLYLDKQQIAFSTDVIIDSGTAQILGDSATVKALYDRITGSAPIGGGQYKFPCNFNSEISFMFGGASFKLRPETFNFGTYTSDPHMCVGGIAAAIEDLGFWVLGEIFLQNVYTKFDVANKRLGFATPA